MTTRISYSSIELKSPMRVFSGRQKASEVSAVSGITITRVKDGELDFFIVEGGAAMPGLEIEASNVSGGIRIKDAPALRGRGGKAKSLDEVENA